MLGDLVQVVPVSSTRSTRSLDNVGSWSHGVLQLHGLVSTPCLPLEGRFLAPVSRLAVLDVFVCCLELI